MPVQTADTLLAELRRHKLLTDEAAACVAAVAHAHNLSPDAWVTHLVEAGLTRFQARTALDGATESLLFGPYILLDRVGDGGMGVVFKARQTRTGRIDALKVLRADKVGSPTVVRRFLREIEVTSRMEHPHIVRAYDAGVVNSQLYLATEFVDGTDLGTRVLSAGPVSVADACLVAYHAALALAHIHKKGLVHRDVKPSNLIRDRLTGAVKLLDLGLSGFNRSVLEDRDAMTLTGDGVVLGTPDFMAPEQIQNPHSVDIRADLYGLGCTLYFLLTGRPPYDGSAVEKMYRHGSAPLPTLILPGGLLPPPGLGEILTRLLAKRPEDRFQTPQELIDALLAIRPGAATPNPDTGAVAAPALETEFGPMLDVADPGVATPLPRLPRAHLGTAPVSWLAVAAVALLFCLGFAAAAVYFTRGR